MPTDEEVCGFGATCDRPVARVVSVYRECCGLIMHTTWACDRHPSGWMATQITQCRWCGHSSAARLLDPSLPASVEAWVNSPLPPEAF